MKGRGVLAHDAGAAIRFLRDIITSNAPIATLTAIEHTDEGTRAHTSSFDMLDGRNIYMDLDRFFQKHADHDIYYQINATSRATRKRLYRHDITHIRGCHVDIDPDKSIDFREARRKVLETAAEAMLGIGDLPKPTYAVSSGSGVQLLFLFPTPLEATQANVEMIEAFNRGLVEAFGGDPATTDISRLLRLPGTVNHMRGKSKEGRPPTLAKVLNKATGPQADPCDLELRLPDSPKPAYTPTPRSKHKLSRHVFTQLRNALRYLNQERREETEAPFDYDTWLRVGFALHADTRGSEEGFELFDEWSSTSSKYDADETSQLWDKIKDDDRQRSLVTGASVFHLAEQHGWTNVLKLDPFIPGEDDESEPATDGREFGKVPMECDTPHAIVARIIAEAQAGALSAVNARSILEHNLQDHRDIARQIRAILRATSYDDALGYSLTREDLAGLRSLGEETIMAELPRDEYGHVEFMDRLASTTKLAGIPLIANITNLCETNTVVANPGVGKTNWLVSASVALMLGVPFLGNEVRQSAVLYIAAEDYVGVTRRFAGALKRYGWQREMPVPLTILDSNDFPIDYKKEADKKKATKIITRNVETLKTKFGLDHVVAVFDTLRDLNSAKENQSDEMQPVLKGMAESAAGCTVFISHHTVKSGEHEAGAGAIKGAVYNSIKLDPGKRKGQVKMSFLKRRNAELSPTYILKTVTDDISDMLPELDDGETRINIMSSIIGGLDNAKLDGSSFSSLTEEDGEAVPKPAKPKRMSPNERKVLDMVQPIIHDGLAGITMKDLSPALSGLKIGNLRDTFASLVRKGYLTKTGNGRNAIYQLGASV